MKPELEIVAEVAQGFEGCAKQAAMMVRAAASAGADTVKFQLVYADELATPDYAYYELFKGLEMPDADWENLAALAQVKGLRLDLDVFGPRSLDLAVRLGAAIKLHGTDTSNIGFLKEVRARSPKKVILGAGGAQADEIDAALEILGDLQIVVMLGFQAYPTPGTDNQIARVGTLVERYKARDNIIIGFGDHAQPEEGFALPFSAAALGAGARVIEKHITLGRGMEIEDFESALNPDEFKDYADAVRATDAALGEPLNQPDFGMSDSERSYRSMIRRHVVARMDLPAGTVLSPDMIELKRTSAESPIFDVKDVYERTLSQDAKQGSPILAGMLQ